jgi:hypothetical protein
VQIDLDKVIASGAKYGLEVSNESEDEAAARRNREDADHRHQLWQRKWLFIVGVLMVVAVFLGCLYLFAMGSADDKKWAGGAVMTIVSGLLGFLVGKAK